MVWIPTLKNHKIKDPPEYGCTSSKPLCNIFLLLPGSAGRRGSAQLPVEPPETSPAGVFPSPHGVREVSAFVPPPAKSHGCGAGPGEGMSHWALLGQTEGAFQRGVQASLHISSFLSEGLVHISWSHPILGGLSGKGQRQHDSGNPFFPPRVENPKIFQMWVK